MICGVQPANLLRLVLLPVLILTHLLCFPQSAVPGHAQLAWVLSCVARIGWLNRMTQFKDKAGKNRENASVGLYTYPVLMAADVLLYQATHVPVGEDQKQHIELARDIAIKFNTDFGVDLFPIPEPMIWGEATRVMSLRDGRTKMSKSDPSDYARINLSDDPETIALKIRKAKTDPHPLPEVMDDLEGRPEACNLISIYAALKGVGAADILETWGGRSFSAFKADLSDLLVSEMAPLNAEWARLMTDPGYVDSILRHGAERAECLRRCVASRVRCCWLFASLTGQKYLEEARRLFLGVQFFYTLHYDVSDVPGLCSG